MTGRCAKHGEVVACAGGRAVIAARRDGGVASCDPTVPHCPECGRTLTADPKDPE